MGYTSYADAKKSKGWKKKYGKGKGKAKGKAGKKTTNVKTNKQLTADVNKLWKGRAIKAHYVQDTSTTFEDGPTIMELTGIGAGEATNQHEGNKIQLRGINIHGYVQVTVDGGTPSISHPTRWSVMVIKTSLDVGIAGVPSYSTFFDGSNLPALMADFDGFRQLNNETLLKTKILYNKEFTLAPNSQDSATGYSSNYPGFKKWSISLQCGNAMVEYRTGTSVALNVQYYIMIKSNSTGAAGNLGLQHAFISKLTFYDVE